MGGSVRVLWDDDAPVEVTITRQGGAPATFTVAGSPVSWPYSVTSNTTFETNVDGEYDVSVTLFGQEIASTPDGTRVAILRGGAQLVFAPSVDDAAAAARSTDDVVSALVESATSNVKASLNASYAPDRAHPLIETPSAPQRIITLAGGQGDETVSSYFSTVTDDTTNYTIGDRGKRAVTGRTSTFGVRYDYPTPLKFPAEDVDAIGVRVYIPDVTKVTVIYVDLYSDAGYTVGLAWQRNSTTLPHKPLVNGWNTLRWPAYIGTRSASWGDVHRVQVMGLANDLAGEITVGHVWAEARRKASLLFINDGPYVDFLANGYPGLKSRGFPVTWSIDPSLLGTTVNSDGIDMTRMTEAELDGVAFENGNSVSAHAWGDIETSGMTAAQIRADAMRTTKWLQGKGYGGWLWRSSWWGEDAPEYAAAKPYYLGMSTYKSDSGPSAWPPIDRYNIPRYSLYQTRTNEQLDTVFEQLRTTKGYLAPFTHRVAANPGPFDMSLTQWDYFLSKIDEGISGGWLEGVTFETLFHRYGGRFTPGMYGGQVAEFIGEDGTVTRKRLP